MSFRRSMFRIYWGMRGVIAPTLRYSQCLFADVVTRYVHPGVDWLDLGCGHQVLPDWRAEGEKAPGSELQVDRRAGQVGFGFRRPSILDLSPRVISRCDRDDGQLVIVFNGEIFDALRLFYLAQFELWHGIHCG
ncbi:MAG: hypothetical protein DMD33_16805 [Gemmatimonadetes bacterium]|nr:MAG: hypothetical protein DMD33_16805 [Gemmatimonadota bacterium]PYO71941.1 MAG: hypothetical protein DMD67_17805 [Gemmatimonadota bacterium]TLY46651.1 MAG: hypothetical protein E6K55_15740 [Gemmatimonadota bacterium]